MRYVAKRAIQHGAVVGGVNTVITAEEGDAVELDEAAAFDLVSCGALEPSADKPKRGRKGAEE
jgi:hypothetical protein